MYGTRRGKGVGGGGVIGNLEMPIRLQGMSLDC